MRIFVYGSLRKGFGNHHLLDDAIKMDKATYVGDAITEGKFTMLHLGGFPGLVAAGDTPIYGELYDVDNDTLRHLDRLEGHPGFYKRHIINVRQLGGKPNVSWEQVSVYLLPNQWLEDNSGRVVASGDWAKKELRPVAVG